VGWDWVYLVRRQPFGLLYQPQMMDDDDYDECGAVGGMIGKGNRSTRRKPAPMPMCPPQIPHDLTRAGTQAAAGGGWRLTVWAMAGPWATNEIDPVRDMTSRRRRKGLQRGGGYESAPEGTSAIEHG
jgi:hypothetical protein